MENFITENIRREGNRLITNFSQNNQNVIGGRGKVEVFLSFSCHSQGIINHLELLTVKMYISNSNKDMFSYLGQTENLEDSNLKFHTTFILDFFFELNQYLKFDIFQKDVKIDSLSFTLGKVMGSRGQTCSFPFSFNNNECKLTITGKQVREDILKNHLSFKINCQMNKCDEYFILISSMFQNEPPKRIYKSFECKGKTPFWEISNGINLHDLCHGDDNLDILFELCTKKKGVIGQIQCSLQQIKNNVGFFHLNSKGKYDGSLNIMFDVFQVTKFLDYLEQGLQISLLVGIDYTGSNGDPKHPNSLHYFFGPEPNQYQQAIQSCGGIVAYYDYDGLFPVYGFGGRLPKTTMVNHCFHVNLNEDPNVAGVDGIIECYKNSFNLIQLEGPTYFGPLILGMIEKVRYEVSRNQSSVYYILLIITDGVIYDMDITKDLLCEAASLPISVIIIGVGNADFTNMVELDGDEVPLTNKHGLRIERDIVQFVKYNDFKMDVSRLAAEVLFEVPEQIEKYYMKYRNFKPLYT
jgi:hypothetical protein